ncbi:MAG TPA: hypothetical protein VMK12_10135, partial [Anaeromyxobacteraceae bacterium]|nr:hypothetical protein [Anaeromyxobacteraceae bacterium]
GFVYFALYYFVFTGAIRVWNLATLGREEPGEAEAVAAPTRTASERALSYIAALGGGPTSSPWMPAPPGCASR